MGFVVVPVVAIRSVSAEVMTKPTLSPMTASTATGRCFTSQNNREAPLSINNFFTWSAWKAVSSGTAVLPAAIIPKYAATHRGWFAARIATRASRRTRVESQFATLSDIRVSSANVTRSTVSLALNLKGNVVGELAGRFLESLVEGGHVGGNLTGN